MIKSSTFGRAALVVAWLSVALSACGGGDSASAEVPSGSPAPAPAPAPSPAPSTVDCALATVRCVNATAGANQEYATIQAAVSAAQAGDTVVVFPGTYVGFTVSRSGTAQAPIRIVANGAAIIDRGGNSDNDGARIDNASYITVEGFTIQSSASSSPRVNRCVSARGATPDTPMRGNIVRAIQCIAPEAEGFYLSEFGNGLVENNTITNPGRNGQTRRHGLYLANAGSDGTTIRGNTITGVTNAESEGMHINGDLSVGGDGLISNLVIENNRIASAGGNNAINMDGVQNSLVQNNLITASGHHALRAYAIDGAAGPRNLRIVNNTFVTDSGWAIKLSEDVGGHVIFNNILIGSAGSLAVGSSVTSNANVLGGVLSDDSENTTISLSVWRSRNAQDANSTTSTKSATFVNATGGDYRLSTSSPARNTGLPSLGGLSAPSTDINGAARPASGQFDIGAFES